MMPMAFVALGAGMIFVGALGHWRRFFVPGFSILLVLTGIFAAGWGIASGGDLGRLLNWSEG